MQTVPDVTLVTYGSMVPLYLAALVFNLPAIEIALEDIRVRYPLLHFDLVVLSKQDNVLCEDLVASTYLVSEYYNRKWDRESIFTILFSSEWNTLLLSTGVGFSDLRDKAAFPTTLLFNGSPQFDDFAETFLALCWRYSWTSAVIIYNETDGNPFYRKMTEAIKARTETATSNVTVFTFPQKSRKFVNASEEVFATILRTARAESRSKSRSKSEFEKYM
ncbi:hypothetical protein RvY_15397 [Ramazzottius varieornatus]|uniref:Receptor ligand binding region domain-containing protein n=1 Tax=Ramazzottius varieornatus TaxID=947166 RepID=A0A1D1VW17_RAMVA|nr:hypothetical protein RvY_15397 [Ramazzottius varieornatus]